MDFHPPVIGLAFAEAKDLPNQAGELTEIRATLKKLEKKNLIHLEELNPATNNSISDFFRKYRRVQIFFYSGHADGFRLKIPEGGHRKGLASFFGLQSDLSLVFLNGCKTEGQVEEYLKAGAKVVLATKQRIQDCPAAHFAIKFFKTLAKRNEDPYSIRRAYEFAAGAINFEIGSFKKPEESDIVIYRDEGFQSDDPSLSDELPWRLYVKDGFEHHLDWSIKQETVVMEKLRQGSRAAYERMKNGRFQKLQIEKLLLPEINSDRSERLKEELFETEVAIQLEKAEEEKMPLEALLETLWKKPNSHFVLKGEGGAGKTVSLIKLWEEYRDKEELGSPIPVYIALNEYNSWPKKYKDNFIISYIARRYLTGDYKLEKKERKALRNCLRSLLKEGGDVRIPSVVLFLDGFNEVTADNSGLLKALADFHHDEKFAGVQIGVTSRYDMSSFSFARNSHLVELQPLEQDKVIQYLQENGIAPGTLHEEDRQRLLGNPMMLTLFTATKAATSELYARFGKEELEFDFKDQMSSYGEIMWNFMEAQLAKYKRDDETDTERAVFVTSKLILQHVLPIVGYEMEKLGLYSFDRKALRKILDKATTYIQSEDFTETFDFFDSNYDDYKETLQLEKDKRSIRKRLLSFLVDRFKILVPEFEETESIKAHQAGKAQYLFLHQHFRDYFSARHIYNEIEVYLRLNESISEPEKRRMPSSLWGRPLPFNVLRNLGEMEGEHYNTLKFDKLTGEWAWSEGQFLLPTSKLSKLLQLCRGKFNEDQVGYTIWNLVTIWKEFRKELSGADFSELDLRNVVLNPIKLSRQPFEKLAAKFNGALLERETLFFNGHTDPIIDVIDLPEKNQFLTYSDDKTIKIWDFLRGECLWTFKGHTSSVKKVVLNKDYSRMLSTSNEGEVILWDFKSKTKLFVKKFEKLDKRNSHAIFHPQRPIFITISENEISLWSEKNGEPIKSIKIIEDNASQEVEQISGEVFNPMNGDHLLLGIGDYSNGHFDIIYEVIIWSIKEESIITKLEKKYERGVGHAEYDPSGQFIVSFANTHENKDVWIFDAKSGSFIDTISHPEIIDGFSFNPKRAQIVTFSNAGYAILWDLLTRELIFQFDVPGGVNSAEFSPDGKTLIIISRYEPLVKEWSVESRKYNNGIEKEIKKLKSGNFINARFRDDNGEYIYLMEGPYDNCTKVLRIWDCENQAFHKSISIGSSDVKSDAKAVFFTPQSNLVLITSEYGNVSAWKEEEENVLFILDDAPRKISKVYYNQDSSRLLTLSFFGSSDRRYENQGKIWDGSTGQLLTVCNQQTDWYVDGTKSPKGTYFSLVHSNSRWEIWDALTAKLIFKPLINYLPVKGIAGFSSDDKIFFIETEDCIHFWEIMSKQYLFNYPKPPGVSGILVSESNNYLFMIFKDHSIKVYDFSEEEGLKFLFPIKGHSGKINSIILSPDNMSILTISEDKKAILWDAKTGALNHYLTNPVYYGNEAHDGGRISGQGFSSDGSLLYTYATENGHEKLRIWKVKDGALIDTISGSYSSFPQKAKFRPNTSQILILFSNGKVMVWDYRKHERVFDLEKTKFASYNENGTRLVTSSWDGEVRILNADTGEPIKILQTEPGLFVKGCLMKDLHQDSELKEKERTILKQYGAIID